MSDLLASAAAFTAVVAVGLLALSVLTLVPFVLAQRMAQTRGFPSARWGAFTLAASVVGLGVVGLALRGDRTPLLALTGVPVAYAGPLVLSLLEAGQRVGGRPGRHQ
ncbi:MAG: hypothetical protein H7323_06110 [Frankiales bacterium]|nr:hypothetical protein [Frankiales bacterium]